MAYKEGDLDKALEGLGEKQSQFDFTKDAIAGSMDALIRKLKANLRKHKHTAEDGESDLGASINPLPVRFMGNKVLIELKFDEYGEYVDKGTRPHKVSYIKILDWINRRKKMQYAAMDFQKKKRIKDLATAKKSLAFAIAKTIERKGTIKRFGYKGSGWFTKEVGENGLKWKDVLAKNISKAIGKDVQVSFKIMAGELNKK